jgi:hypothetical protein
MQLGSGPPPGCAFPRQRGTSYRIRLYINDCYVVGGCTLSPAGGGRRRSRQGVDPHQRKLKKKGVAFTTPTV